MAWRKSQINTPFPKIENKIRMTNAIEKIFHKKLHIFCWPFFCTLSQVIKSIVVFEIDLKIPKKRKGLRMKLKKQHLNPMHINDKKPE